ncbi:phospholipid-transporting ATPase FetA-like isoform X2 [Talpa occidentalis]|uniref:phospholipid-transporting ATPase FetA-like isoform X2 n=1 Tax=Talpa occidentalis TaxID=50954 RepID=UPI00188F065A|nr:phospholipid-transporting ATPase FetA-like isoform X2 [Talpa occidentalis]
MKHIQPFITEILGNYHWYCSAMSVFETHSKQSEECERHLRANNREFNTLFDYPDNSIKTSKYNVLNFLPLNLFEQFQRLANAYFLILLILQLIPQISSLAWYTTVVPLIVVLSITAVKDASDDLKRHKNDNQVNNKSVLVLTNGRMQKNKWMNIQVGDIIKIENNQPVPADILLLSSSEPYSLTYIETAELDGETNLKVKQALSVTSDLEDNLKLLSAFNGEVKCETPNNKLDRFAGVLSYKGNNYSLDHDKLLLRGCVIRNTDWCCGLVIFTGPDTKLMQNSGKYTFKQTQIDHLMNVLVIWIFLILGSMCFILAIGNGLWQNQKGYYFQTYLPWKEYVFSSFGSASLLFWSYFIILNTMVPISLYVSVEIIRLGNSYYINWDQKMFHALKNIPAQARTTTLNEALGQVKYIFSDKTGTLTQNIMVFHKCSINGTFYGDVFDENGKKVEISAETQKVDFSYNELADPKFIFYDNTLVEAVRSGDHQVCLFFLSLSLCHTVMLEEKEKGELIYQAQSPDEGALVTAARNFGFVFRARTSETITVVKMGKTEVYQLLAILDFSSARKRMSVIVRTPEDRVMLFCKGADTVLCQLLHPACRVLRDVTLEHLDDFAREGLRTLMVAYRELDDAFFQTWSEKYSEACLSLDNRERKISNVCKEVEREMMLLGATAIEDKLQDKVPQTIATLSRARIKTWILTGDKQETAMNIAYACNIFKDEMDGIFIVKGNNDETIREELRSARYQMNPSSLLKSDPVNSFFATNPKTHLTIPEEMSYGSYGLVISGYSLAYALEGKLELELLRTACMCKGVICCRMTPLQKAQVVELVKRYKNVVTLAIGDGANDVGMIKAAHIGVGICGQEGMQAMLSSDYAFSEFHCLQRLLLTVYDTWFIAFYNLVYTALPVLGLSLFDQDVSETWSLHFPELYEPGQHNLYFNKKEFVKCLVHGLYSSLVLFFIPLGTFHDSVRSDGKEIFDYQSFSLVVQTSLLTVVTVQIALDTTYWTMISHFFIWGSLGFYFCMLFFLYSESLCLMFPGVFNFLGVARNSLTEPQMWLSLVLSVVLCILPVFGCHLLRLLIWPFSVEQVINRIHHCMKQPRPPVWSKMTASPRRSAYAFSHKHGFGALITSGQTMQSRRSKKNFITSGGF